MKINDTITYTPETIRIEKGGPVQAKIEGISAIDGSLRIRLENGSTQRVEARQCEVLRSKDA